MFTEFLSKAIYRQEIDFKLLEDIFKSLKLLNHDQKMQLLIVLSQSCMEGRKFNFLTDLLLSLADWQIQDPVDAIDICGTGGSGIDRLNCSTLSAFILSSMRIPVVKHGNRAGSGRFGSWDLLSALDIPIITNPERITELLADVQLAFIYAPQVYPFLKELSDVRKSLRIASIFNVLGPLLNPFRPKIQFVGCSYEQFMPLMYQCGRYLGRDEIVIYRAESGLDDIDLSTDTTIFNGKFTKIRACDFACKQIPIEQILVKSNDEKIKIAKKIIDGSCESAHMTHVIANTAFFYARIRSLDYPAAFSLIHDHVKSGAVAEHFKRVKEAYVNCIRENYTTEVNGLSSI